MAVARHASALRDVVPAETARAIGARLYQDLHDDIISGRRRPGEDLSETRVAEQYGVSRTPVREVFHRLVEEGFLRVVPQVGTYVAPINLAAVRDSQYIREALECRAIRITAAKAKAPAIRALRQELRVQERAVAIGDRARFFASDERMHQTLLTAAGHPQVWDTIAAAKAQLDRVRYLSLEAGDWLAMIFEQHRVLIDRIADHDAAGAERAMQAHLRTVFAAADRIAAEHADFFEGARAKPRRRRA
ncbi:MAG TPA: GntR family transcriptional regulator [Stellaceae bacterium]|nr:GntR family transcriptional regulator [Stellaceae bacterium]